ncbi:MAG TPA: hypothetical protein VKH19_18820 [Gemmatimonadaceae bacterium]|nr:hypothetical protein [Gemmatimonadaceae bacterium]
MKPHDRSAWTSPRLMVGMAILLAGAASILGCAAGASSTRPARSTLVVGIDVSGSFRKDHESSIEFAANYLYARLHGLGGLKQPTAVFVGTIGGEHPQETKSFQPIHTFQNMSVAQIADYLHREYHARDGLTDFNPFFTRVATLVKRQNLVLSPIEIVLLTDGVPDMAAAPGDSLTRYRKIRLDDLEYLSKSVTVRVLYPRPTIAVRWEKQVPRHRVRMWTVDDEVMVTWRNHWVAGAPPDRQSDLWKWIADNVDFRVRSAGVL